MKLFIPVVIAFLLFWPQARADETYYFGPHLGSTSVSQSNGASDREGHFSYGVEGYYILQRFIAGLKYSAFSGGDGGTEAVSVKQSDQWISAEGKYKFLDEDFSPYIGVGLGALIETVNTTVMGASEGASGTWFVPDVGIGLWGRLSSKVGLNLSMKYYQYANVNGWDYSISVGITPENL